MNRSEARGLILDLLERSCCRARGNVNGYQDGPDYVTVADLTYLVDLLFRGGPAPPCPAEADVTGGGRVDIADLASLVEFLFRDGREPLPCP
jgi:hypothetical protein